MLCKCGSPLRCKVWNFLVAIAVSLSLHIHCIYFDRTYPRKRSWRLQKHTIDCIDIYGLVVGISLVVVLFVVGGIEYVGFGCSFQLVLCTFAIVGSLLIVLDIR